MDDITKKKLDHEAHEVRDAMPDFEDQVADIQGRTHATRAHMMRLGIEEQTMRDGRFTLALAMVGMVVGRLVVDCRLPRFAVDQYMGAMLADQFAPTSVSDGIVACIGLAGAQQLERFIRIAISELRLCTRPDSDGWGLLSFLVTFMGSALPGGDSWAAGVAGATVATTMDSETFPW